VAELTAKLHRSRAQIADLRKDLDGYAQVIIAQQLELTALRDEDKTVVALKRKKR
jgi:hypothetical protein